MLHWYIKANSGVCWLYIYMDIHENLHNVTNADTCFELSLYKCDVNDYEYCVWNSRYTEFDEILLYSVLEYKSTERKWFSFQQ